MVKDRDIRRFMDKCRMRMPENDRFMENLVSQIDRLPVPEKMNVQGNRSLSETTVRIIASRLKKRYRIQAVVILAANMAVCLCLLLAMYAVFGQGISYSSPVLALLADWRYVIFGILAAGCIGLSLSCTVLDQS